MDYNQDSIATISGSNTNVLISQQIGKAYRDFAQMIDLILSDEDRVEDLPVILFQNRIPCAVRPVKRDRTDLPYVHNGLLPCMFYYDPQTRTYRVSGGKHLTYDFIFVDETIEKSRQTLEVVHEMYIQTYTVDKYTVDKYTEKTGDYGSHLARKFNQLLSSSDLDSINTSVDNLPDATIEVIKKENVD